MTRHFIIVIEKMTPRQQSSFHGYIEENGIKWWHWFDQFWIVATEDEKITAEVLRDKLNDDILKERSDLLVIEIKARGPWAGASVSEENVFDWIRKNWPRREA